MRSISGLREVASAFDGFIVDLWGVIHDGVTPYEGAVECLARLRERRAPVVLLSNAPRRADVARRGLRRLGVADDLYTGIVTSGETTHGLLAARADPFFAALGRRLYHLGPPKDRTVFEGLDYAVADGLEGADFILNTGPDDERDPDAMEPFGPILDQAASLGLPMICANPDLEVIRDGRAIMCAGALAAEYEARGGRVRQVGKPDPAVYAPVLEMLGVARDRALAIGDSLRTDIAGARGAGLHSCWVLGGIHAAALRDGQDSADDVAHACGLEPFACVKRLVW